MKRILVWVWLCTMTLASYGQGLVNFFNNSATLVSAATWATPPVAINGPAGSFYFALLTSPVGANNFTFSGFYGTNQIVPGRFNGGVGVQVAGWSPGTARDFKVAGWYQSLGATFNPSWLTSYPAPFGISSIGTGVAGGFNGTGVLPNAAIFGGPTGIQNGFVVFGIPEPKGAYLLFAGFAVCLVFQRRVWPAREPRRVATTSVVWMSNNCKTKLSV
jgi:hypothetical protein